MNLGKAKAFRVLFWQLCWCWLVIVASLFVGHDAKKSCLSALLVVVVPQVLFINICFLENSVLYVKKILNLFYIGQVTKLLLTGVMLLITFKISKVNILWFFISYIGALLAYFWAPLFFEKNI
jgi:F0F1-type ATP synthase assembly protein I